MPENIYDEFSLTNIEALRVHAMPVASRKIVESEDTSEVMSFTFRSVGDANSMTAAAMMAGFTGVVAESADGGLHTVSVNVGGKSAGRASSSCLVEIAKGLRTYVVESADGGSRSLTEVKATKDGRGSRGGSQPGNPLHDKMGNFTSKEQIAKDGGGSWSLDGSKPKKAVPSKGGIKFRFTKNPCGRIIKKAKPDLGNRAPNRCWDGGKAVFFGVDGAKEKLALLKKKYGKKTEGLSGMLGSLLDSLDEAQKRAPTFAPADQKAYRKGSFKLDGWVVSGLKDMGLGDIEDTLGDGALKILGKIGSLEAAKFFGVDSVLDAQEIIARNSRDAMKLFVRNLRKVSPKLAELCSEHPENVPIIFYAIVKLLSGKDMAVEIAKRDLLVGKGSDAERLKKAADAKVSAAGSGDGDVVEAARSRRDAAAGVLAESSGPSRVTAMRDFIAAEKDYQKAKLSV